LSDLIEKAENFSDSIIDSFNKGSRNGILASNLFEQFGFTFNPFDTNNVIGNSDLIIDKVKNIINKLAERLGACYQSQKSLLIVSPKGAGRTSILKLLNATLNRVFDKNFSSYVDASSKWSGFSFKEEAENEGHQDSDGDDRIDNFQKWMREIDFSKTKIILVDDADAFITNVSQYMSAVKFEHLEVPTMVFCSSPTTYSLITKTELFLEIFGDIFWIMPLEREDIKQILLKSIEGAAASSKNNNYTSPFEDSAIDKIADYSLGLPGEAARLAYLCLKNAYQIGVSKINVKLVEQIAVNEGFDAAQKLLRKEIKLDGTKYKVALEILTQFFRQGHNVERTFIISRFSEMASSTLSYHLKDLTNSGILKQERIGYKVFYVISRPVRSALEIMTLPSLEADDHN
jgi:DNA-binding transcriptional ArsR family regulator